MAGRLAPITKSNSTIALQGTPNLPWTDCTGFNPTRDKSQYSDGITNRKYPLLGLEEIPDVTIRKPHDPVLDREFFDWMKNTYDEAVGTTLTVISTPQGRNPAAGMNYTLLGAKVVSYKVAEVDRMSSDPAMLEVVLAPMDYTIN